MAVWEFQHYLFLGIIRVVQAGFKKKQCSGTSGPCMMGYTEIGLVVGYEWVLWRMSFPGAGCREGQPLGRSSPEVQLPRNHSLESVNYKQWWTPHDDLAPILDSGTQPEVSNTTKCLR